MSDLEPCLADSEHIDWRHPLVLAKAAELAAGAAGDEAIARRCFEFVRDSITHSWDYRLNPASAVLLHGTGYCYAKSHLLGRAECYTLDCLYCTYNNSALL